MRFHFSKVLFRILILLVAVASFLSCEYSGERFCPDPQYNLLDSSIRTMFPYVLGSEHRFIRFYKGQPEDSFNWKTTKDELRSYYNTDESSFTCDEYDQVRLFDLTSQKDSAKPEIKISRFEIDYRVPTTENSISFRLGKRKVFFKAKDLLAFPDSLVVRRDTSMVDTMTVGMSARHGLEFIRFSRSEISWQRWK